MSRQRNWMSRDGFNKWSIEDKHNIDCTESKLQIEQNIVQMYVYEEMTINCEEQTMKSKLKEL